jgi:SAM-dependent methyltransferase
MNEKQLPEAEIYEKGLRYWPYRSSQQFVLDKVAELSPLNGCLLDIMCGPGNLLGRITKICPNLKLIGVDIDPRYIQYGNRTYPQASFEKGDVLSWSPISAIDIVICTGALHHIPYDMQEDAIAHIAAIAIKGKDSSVIISDCYVDDYTNEMERKEVAAKLGYKYLRETIRNDAPDEVIAWTVDILWNDVLKKEYKTSVVKRLPLLEKYFRKVETVKSWPVGDTGYGDYIHICSL